jgi:hypothetical protein
MLVTLSEHQSTNETLLSLRRVLSDILSNPASVDSPPFSEGKEIARQAIAGIDAVNFPRFPKSRVVAVGFSVIAAHLSQEVINLTVLLAHFFAFDERCEEIDAIPQSNAIREILLNLIENQFVPYQQ